MKASSIIPNIVHLPIGSHPQGLTTDSAETTQLLRYLATIVLRYRDGVGFVSKNNRAWHWYCPADRQAPYFDAPHPIVVGNSKDFPDVPFDFDLALHFRLQGKEYPDLLNYPGFEYEDLPVLEKESIAPDSPSMLIRFKELLGVAQHIVHNEFTEALPLFTFSKIQSDLLKAYYTIDSNYLIGLKTFLEVELSEPSQYFSNIKIGAKPINVNSYRDIGKWLFTADGLNLKPQVFTAKGEPSTGSEALVMYADRQEVQMLTKQRQVSHELKQVNSLITYAAGQPDIKLIWSLLGSKELYSPLTHTVNVMFCSPRILRAFRPQANHKYRYNGIKFPSAFVLKDLITDKHLSGIFDQAVTKESEPGTAYLAQELQKTPQQIKDELSAFYKSNYGALTFLAGKFVLPPIPLGLYFCKTCLLEFSKVIENKIVWCTLSSMIESCLCDTQFPDDNDESYSYITTYDGDSIGDCLDVSTETSGA